MLETETSGGSRLLSHPWKMEIIVSEAAQNVSSAVRCARTQFVVEMVIFLTTQRWSFQLVVAVSLLP